MPIYSWAEYIGNIQEVTMANADKPVKINLSFQEAIRFFANPKPTQKDPSPTEPDSTTEAAPQSAPSNSQTSDHR